MSDWRVAIRDDRWPTNEALVMVWRDVGSCVEVLMSDGRREHIDHNVKAPDDAGVVLPFDALSALRDAIDERTGRRQSDAVADELRKAIEVERGRVDRVLGALLPGGSS